MRTGDAPEVFTVPILPHFRFRIERALPYFIKVLLCTLGKVLWQ